MNKEDFNLEDREIYKLLNSIKIEESEFEDMDEEVQKLQKERIKKNLNKRINSNNSEQKWKSKFKVLKVCCMVASVGFVSLIGIGTVSPAFAQSIPIVNSIVQYISDINKENIDYASYSQIINKSVTDNGVTVTINDVIADDSKLLIGYTIKSDKKLNNFFILGLGKFLTINGKVDGSSGGASGKNIDDYTYVGSEEISTELLGESEEVNVDLNITEIGTDIKGNWNFAFSVSKDELVNASTVFKPNYKVDFPDSTVTVDKVVFSPIETSIFYRGNYKSENVKELNRGFHYNSWIVYDDKGVELKWKGGGGESSNINTFTGEMDFIKIKDIPKYITIIPCKVIPSGGYAESIDENGVAIPIPIETIDSGENSKVINLKNQIIYPIELSQGEMGKLVIKEIKTENNNIIVKFIAEGKAPYTQASELRIKNIKGELLEAKDYDLENDKMNPNEFIMNINSLNHNEQFTLCTTKFNNWEIREDLKFEIQLNK